MISFTKHNTKNKNQTKTQMKQRKKKKRNEEKKLKMNRKSNTNHQVLIQLTFSQLHKSILSLPCQVLKATLKRGVVSSTHGSFIVDS